MRTTADNSKHLVLVPETPEVYTYLNSVRARGKLSPEQVYQNMSEKKKSSCLKISLSVRIKQSQSRIKLSFF